MWELSTAVLSYELHDRDAKVDQLRQRQDNTRKSLSRLMWILQQGISQYQGLGQHIRDASAKLIGLQKNEKELKLQCICVAWQKVCPLSGSKLASLL